jgi:protein-disulfide isomerase
MLRKILLTLFMTIMISACNVMDVLETLELTFEPSDAIPIIDYATIPVTRTEDGAFVAGNPNAQITIVVFEDYRCPHCINYEPTLERLMREYVATGKVKFEPRMLQTASPDTSVFLLAQCAGEEQPDRFFEFRSEIYNMTSEGWDAASSPREFANTFDLNFSDILACTSNADQVSIDQNLAQTVGATGTPFVLYKMGNSGLMAIPTGQVPSYDQLKEFLDTLLLSNQS